MSTEVWNVTRCHIDDKPRNTWNVPPANRPASLPVAFRLYDDDGNLYYSGRATCEHAVLRALDVYSDSAGTTTAEIQNAATGKWDQLN